MKSRIKQIFTKNDYVLCIKKYHLFLTLDLKSVSGSTPLFVTLRLSLVAILIIMLSTATRLEGLDFPGDPITVNFIVKFES